MALTPELGLSSHGLPTASVVAAILGADAPEALCQSLNSSLVAPCTDISERPSKRLRALLVRVGYEIAYAARAQQSGAEQIVVATECQFDLCTRALELLHAGSLIVDDIQDGSTERRGGPTAHARYGLPSALCAGNWLYFWPLRLVRSCEFPLSVEHQIVSLYCEAVERAHYGQALDLNVKVDSLQREEVGPAAVTAAGLKTGAITGLACAIGATMAGAPAELIVAVRDAGERFGIALQKLDDLGNLTGRREPDKRREDLRHLRLSAVWSFAAERGDDFYRTFREAVAQSNAGDERPLDDLLASSGLMSEATATVAHDLDLMIEGFVALAEDEAASRSIHSKLISIKETLIHAYF